MPCDASLAFTIATLVTSQPQYEEMLASFLKRGFASEDVEFLALDNRDGNCFDAYAGIRAALNMARGQYVIVCHQDIRLLADGRDVLETQLAALSRLDPLWAIAGNAGANKNGLCLRISDPHAEDQRVGNFPSRVLSLDENFLVFNGSQTIAPSETLSGFHLYGTDCCLQAELGGRSAYVIDFHLRHLSGGAIGAEFYRCLEALEDCYFGKMNLGRVQTTCVPAMITTSTLALFTERLGRSFKKMKKLKRERDRQKF